MQKTGCGRFFVLSAWAALRFFARKPAVAAVLDVQFSNYRVFQIRDS